MAKDIKKHYRVLLLIICIIAAKYTNACNFSIQLSFDSIICSNANNGWAVAYVSGGSGVYTYQWNNGSNSSTITNLGPGAYNVIVTDVITGCSAASSTITIPAALPPTIQLTHVNVRCSLQGSIISNIIGGTPPYVYSWTGSNGFTASNQNIYNIDTGTYSVIVTDHIGCVDSASAIINQDSCSWIGFYNKLENNPEITSSKTLLESYTNNTSVAPLKICADGSDATVIKYVNNDSSINNTAIKFVIKNDPLGSDTDYFGSFYSIVYTDTITAKYVAPKYQNQPSLYRTDAIQVINSANGSVLYEQPIQIYRAPVLLVHGLWGSISSMSTIHDKLIASGKYEPLLVHRADYENSNSIRFSYNANVIKNEINAEFLRLRAFNFSAGKVDIVAHSMGGILTRIYLQNNDCSGGVTQNCYRDDIHKLITLNTPHSGTQMANFLLSDTATGAETARNVLDWVGLSWDLGAVNDLQCNSSQISLLNGVSRNNHIVPSYSIITTDTVSSHVIPSSYVTLNPEATIAYVIVKVAALSADAFLDILYAGTPSDLIVPITSQQGGITNYKSFNSTSHGGSHDNDSVIAKVEALLDENTTGNIYFSNGGFNPPILSPTFKCSQPGFTPNNNDRSGTVTINNPQSGFSCAEGQMIPINVSASSNINRLMILSGNKNLGITLFDTLTNMATINYLVPNNAIGTIKIMAIAYDSDGFVDLDTLDFTVTASASLDSITFVNDYISIPVGQATPYQLLGSYNDSTLRNLSSINNVLYSVSDSSIATIYGNVVEGQSVGTTMLNASYQGKNASIFITVYDGDDWVLSDSVISAISIQNSFGTDNPKLLVYPNPNGGRFIIASDIEGSGSIDIYSITGEKVYSHNVSSLQNSKVDISSFAKGIYILRVTSPEGICTHKLILR